MNVSRPCAQAVLAVCFLLIAATTFGGQFGFSTGNRPSNRPVNEPPKPKTIRGVVEDEKGAAIAGARVFILDTKTQLTRTAKTNAEGVYEMKNLPAEVTYDVTAEFNGVSEKKSVSGLLNRPDNIVDFQLKITAGNSAPKDDGPTIQSYDGMKLRASLDLPEGIPAPIPAILLLHGYGEDRSVFDRFKKTVLEHGWAAMTIDLRGHGSSRMKNGQPLEPTPAWRSSIQEFPPDLEPALDWLKSQPRVDSTRIAIVGYDVGANLALIASGRFREVRTVVAIKPSLAESSAMAGSAQDFNPRSALIIAPAPGDESQWTNTIARPIRLVTTESVRGGAAAWVESAPVVDATIQWLKETF
ncbi:MAG TPA: alpha/beta fold hydrolase [Terriglobia bacterium]|nr:alpha/beta fold hydrolase [Terriglobia bacterium]